MTFQSNPTNWSPPDGLGYSSLRPVSMTGQGIAMALAGLLFLLGGPVLGWVIANKSNHQAQRQNLLREQGVETSAVITRVWRSGGKDSQHMVSYRFTAANGDVESEVSTPRKIWDGLHEGTRLAVRYVPSDPEVNHPVEWQSSRTPAWLAWLMLFVFSWPSVLFWALIRRQSLLLSEGRPAPGVVTKVRRSDKQTIVYYEFKLLSGAVAKGKSGAGRRAPAVGSSVCVLYSPDNPRRNALYPLQFVKLGKS